MRLWDADRNRFLNLEVLRKIFSSLTVVNEIVMNMKFNLSVRIADIYF